MAKMMSTEEAAKRLRVSGRTVRRWADRGWIESRSTLGGHRRIPESAIEAAEELGKPK